MGVVANQMAFDLIAKITNKIKEKLKRKKAENIEVKRCREFLPEARSVREEVFIHEQGFSYDYDEIDDIAMHFVMFEKGSPVAACRVFESEGKGTFVLGRLAVKKVCRGRDFGSMMLDAAMEYVESVGGDSLILHSQLQAKDFYAKNGFEEYGEIEYEEECPHIWMKKAVCSIKRN